VRCTTLLHTRRKITDQALTCENVAVLMGLESASSARTGRTCPGETQICYVVAANRRAAMRRVSENRCDGPDVPDERRT
jgi:hypothetical protein